MNGRAPLIYKPQKNLRSKKFSVQHGIQHIKQVWNMVTEIEKWYFSEVNDILQQ